MNLQNVLLALYRLDSHEMKPWDSDLIKKLEEASPIIIRDLEESGFLEKDIRTHLEIDDTLVTGALLLETRNNKICVENHEGTRVWKTVFEYYNKKGRSEDLFEIKDLLHKYSYPLKNRISYIIGAVIGSATFGLMPCLHDGFVSQDLDRAFAY